MYSFLAVVLALRDMIMKNGLPVTFICIDLQEFVICETDFHLTLALILFGIAGFIGSYIFGYLQDRYALNCVYH